MHNKNRIAYQTSNNIFILAFFSLEIIENFKNTSIAELMIFFRRASSDMK
jgi:hypothetical protein